VAAPGRTIDPRKISVRKHQPVSSRITRDKSMKISMATKDDSSLVTGRASAGPLWLVTGFWISIAISVAVVVRRLVAIMHPSASAPAQMAALDAAFASHTALTVSHIVPAMAFVLLIPFVFLRGTSAAWAERLLFPLGAVVGVTAYAMSAYSIGGWIERSAVLLFNSLFLFSLRRAYGYARGGDHLLKRRWMTRAVGILLGIATTRPVMGIFFATSRWTHVEPRQFFGIAFWIGFSINTIVVELWLHSRVPDARSA
jgi:hypothetical protein